MMRKGIVLAGGAGTRLKPLTDVVCKQLLPIYDKPMVFYPISILMLAGIKEIAIISTPKDIDTFKAILGDGSQYGIRFEYLTQSSPNGIAEAFVIARDFIGGDSVSLVLGDNLIFGHGLPDLLQTVANRDENTIFAYHVNDPRSFGVVEFDPKTKLAYSLEEKPANPKSNYAVPGLYFYKNSVVDDVLKLKPSDRGEFEITDLNYLYMNDKDLRVELFGRGTAWLDTGTYDSLLDAGQFIATLQNRQGLKVADLFEIAKYNKWIDF